MATDAGLRLQVATGAASHLHRFGRWDGGFWLPECGYVPGLERELADHGARVFCVDQTNVSGFDHLLPVATGAGPVAVPIDWASVELVWNDENGYPAHGTYRNYWGRTVHDLSRGATPGSHTSTTSRSSSRASTPASSWLALRSGSRAAASSAARSTPSCSATGGTRASTGSARCSRRLWPRGCGS